MKKQKTNQIGFDFTDYNRPKPQKKGMLWILFLIYLAAMTWIILFKLSISVHELPDIRSINLIPFAETLTVNGQEDWSEVIMNGVIFIPFGIYLSALFPKCSFLPKLLSFAAISFVYEACQYAFSIGASDITDLIANTLGGCVGVLIYALLRFILRGDRRAITVVKVLALLATVLMIGLIAFILIYNI